MGSCGDGTIDRGAVVARIGEVPIESPEFLAFLDRARHTGYRPATDEEAQRLLVAYLGERALALEAERIGAPVEADGLELAFAALVRRWGAPIRVDEAEVEAYREQIHRTLGSAPRAWSAAETEQARRLLERRREAVQRDAVLERLLEEHAVHVDRVALQKLVRSGAPFDPRPPEPAS